MATCMTMTLILRPLFCVIFSLALLASAAHAQTTYRWLDPATGRIVISDMPPPMGVKQVIRQDDKKSDKANDDTSGGNKQSLPYAARQAAEKFPVTLYTAANCIEGCRQARELLNNRGVPFTERMMQGQEEIAELTKRLGGEATVPSLSVGPQYLKGFEASTWQNLLDLAGYPKSPAYGAKPSGIFAK